MSETRVSEKFGKLHDPRSFIVYIERRMKERKEEKGKGGSQNFEFKNL